VFAAPREARSLDLPEVALIGHAPGRGLLKVKNPLKLALASFELFNILFRARFSWQLKRGA